MRNCEESTILLKGEAQHIFCLMVVETNHFGYSYSTNIISALEYGRPNRVLRWLDCFGSRDGPQAAAIRAGCWCSRLSQAMSWESGRGEDGCGR